MKCFSRIAALFVVLAGGSMLADAASFTNATSINLPTGPGGTSPGSPYPSSIVVSNVSGTITKVTVTLNNINHDRPDDLQILLVGPTGKKFVLLADAGGTGTPATGINLTFDDAAGSFVADSGPLSTGIFKPTCVDAQANIQTEFVAPAPAAPYDVPAPSGAGTLALTFNGTSPNGTWSLYVVDDIPSTPGGSITGGWTLNITGGATSEPSVATVVSSQNPSFTGSSVTFTASVKRTNNTAVTNGGVIFLEGATVLQASNVVNASGQVTFTTSALTEGVHIITAQYTGSPNFSGSSATVTQTVDNTTAISGNTFANRGTNTLGDTASVYPSRIFVTNLAGSISKVTMTVSNITHPRPDDLEFLLVAPNGAHFIVLADAGGTAGGLAGVTLRFDDAAGSLISDTVAPGTGIYRPTDYNSTAAVFPLPAPAGPYNHPAPAGGSTFANIFNGVNPNGTWSLYMVDDVPGSNGTNAGGWALTFTTSGDAPTKTLLTSSLNPSLVGQSVTFTAAVKRVSDSVAVTNGSVTFREGANILAAGMTLNTNGLATFTTAVLTEGSHIISADYNGVPGSFNVSSGSFTQRVDNATVVNNTRFSNPGAIAIASGGSAPFVYPSRINVTGLNPGFCKLSVTLSNISIDRPDDLELLLVSPTGAQLVLMSDVGGTATPANNVTLNFSDAGASFLPDTGPLVAGIFKPTSFNITAANFPAPAPAPPYTHPAPFGAATLNGSFAGSSNGYWSLYVLDDVPGGPSLTIANGWALNFSFPQVATVGGSQSICIGGTTSGLGGNAPTGTGGWSVVGGGTGTFNPNTNAPNATFTHTGGSGPITLRWTLTEPGCGSSSADVVVSIPCTPVVTRRVAVLGAPGIDTWNDDVRAKIVGGGSFAQVDGFLLTTPNSLPGLLQLRQYESVLVYSDAPFNDPTGLGNVLADYVDQGGGVVLATFGFGTGYMQGRFLTGGYMPFTSGAQANPGVLTMVKDLPAHPILDAVASFNGGTASFHNTPIVTSNATLIAHWNNGQPLVAAKSVGPGRVVGLNFYPPSSAARSDFWPASTDGGRLMANALLWAGKEPPTILSGPSNLVVLAGATVNFNVAAVGTAPLTYQWRRNGVISPGATSSNFSFVATVASAGQYSVVVSNDYGAVLSSNATLTVISSTSLVVNATDTGWYDVTGSHNPGNPNYLAGNVGNQYYRDWFVFNIPPLNGPVARAELRVKTYEIFSPTGSETYQLRHVNTPVATLIAGGSGLTGIYNDLGDGPTYAARTFVLGESSRFITFPLNRTLRTAVAAAAGGAFALGGEVVTLDADPANSEYVLGASQGNPGDVQLLLTVGSGDAPNVGYFTDGNPSSIGPLGPITSAGYAPVFIGDIATQSFAGLRILFIDESFNGAPSSALLARLPEIKTWVTAGGRLLVHDRGAGLTTPNPFLIGTPGLGTVSFFTSDLDAINPATTLVTAGPFGILSSTSLDGGTSSAHGYATNLPPGARAILSIGGNSNQVVSFSYPLGAGFVYYSTIPLDYYLDGAGGGSAIGTNSQFIYTPNVLTYLHTLNPPLKFLPPVVSASGALPLYLGNADNSAVVPDRVPQIRVYSATNVALSFSNWSFLPNPLVLSNGLLRLDGLTATNPPRTFFRAVETP